MSSLPYNPQIFDMGQRPQGGQMQRPQGGRMPLGVAPPLNAQMRRQNPEMFGQLGQQNQPLMQEMIGRGGTNTQLQEAAALGNAANSRAVQQNQPLMQEMIGRGGTNAQLQEAAALNAANSRAVQQEPQIAGGFLNRMKNFSMNSAPPVQQALMSPPPLDGVRADGMSANDLQRQLNRGTVAAEDLASTQASINDLQTQAPMPSPPSSAIPTPVSEPQYQAGPFGNAGSAAIFEPPTSVSDVSEAPADASRGFSLGPMFSQMFGSLGAAHNAGPQQQSPYMGSAPRDYHANDFERMGPPPQQQIQPAPQQQMAGGYGLTGSYQGDQFSRGVMSLPQIQDNFYSPPAGNYTAPPITSPYSMF